jgi:hypothetical protein
MIADDNDLHDWERELKKEHFTLKEKVTLFIIGLLLAGSVIFLSTPV